MPRITHVRKAQQRYETVPVIDPETGEQKRTPVMRNGVQRTTKKGRPIFLGVTREDRTKPKPNLKCDYPGCQFPDKEIKPGQAYKHITPKSGPFGGRQRNRHAEHPNWKPWEYSNSLSARTAQIEHDFTSGLEEVESEDEVTALLEEAAGQARELSEEKAEAATNIEDGFGHETETSMQLNEQAEGLEEWASEIESMDIPDFPEPEDADCDTCGGEGTVEDEEGQQVECEDCNGTGHPEEVTGDQISDWLSEIESNFPQCPV